MGALTNLMRQCRDNRNAFYTRIAKQQAKESRQMHKNGQTIGYDAITGRYKVTDNTGSIFDSQPITTGTVPIGASATLTDTMRNIPKIDGMPTL